MIDTRILATQINSKKAIALQKATTFLLFTPSIMFVACLPELRF
jgi:hypothetical protein